MQLPGYQSTLIANIIDNHVFARLRKPCACGTFYENIIIAIILL